MIVSALVQEWTDAVIILAIVLSIAMLSFVPAHNASNVAEKLKTQVDTKAAVLCGGLEESILAEEVVPGMWYCSRQVA